MEADPFGTDTKLAGQELSDGFLKDALGVHRTVI